MITQTDIKAAIELQAELENFLRARNTTPYNTGEIINFLLLKIAILQNNIAEIEMKL